MRELASLAPEDAFRLAIFRSGLSPKEVAVDLGWTESFLRRVVTSEKYFPSFEDIPLFCQAVDNTLVIEWLQAKTAGSIQGTPPGVTCGFLKDQVIELADKTGAVAGTVKEAVADNRLTKKELRDLIKTVLTLSAIAYSLAGALRNAEKKVLRNE